MAATLRAESPRPEVSSQRITCPFCRGRDLVTRCRSGRRLRRRDVCILCRGEGTLHSTEFTWFQSLQRQMQLVVDAIQGGDDDRAYREARTAAGIAIALLHK